MRPGWLAAPPLLALAVFAPALAGGFVHDDHLQIVHNPLVASLERLPTLWTTNVWAGAGAADAGWYRPLMTTAFALERALFGAAPLGFHALELAWFAAAVALAGALVRALGAGVAPAVAAGAFAALHPVQAEAAAWVSARCEVLAAALGLAALLVHARRAPARGPGAVRRGCLVGLLLFGALAAKESAVVFAPALLAVDRVRRADPAPAAWLARHGGWLAALAGYLALRAAALGSPGGGLLAPVSPATWLAAIGQGVLRIAWPAALTIAPPAPAGAAALAAGAAALGAGAIGAGLAWRRRASALVPLVLGGGQLAVAAVAAARLGELADRYLLLPVIAAGWLLALGADAALRRRPRLRAPARAAGAGAALALALLSVRHVTVYADDETLWRDAWRKNPTAVRPPLNLAAWHLDHERPEEALRWLARAEALAPDDPQVALNRAVAAERLGDPDAARRTLEALLARHPEAWSARLRLAHLELDAGRADTAAAHYRAVVDAAPLAAEAWAGLGVAQHRRGRKAEARRAIERALALDPHVQNAAALRALLGRLGS